MVRSLLTPNPYMRLRTSIALLAPFAVLSCGSDSTGPQNRLRVEAVTTGLNPDADGYFVTVGRRRRAEDPSQRDFDVPGIRGGVSLGRVLGHCRQLLGAWRQPPHVQRYGSGDDHSHV